MFVTTKLIKEKEFSLIKIYGEVGIGKTTYALKVLYQYYGDWNKALKSIVDLDEFMDLLDDANTQGYKLEPLLLDDASLYLYYMDYNEDPVKKFMKALTIARTICKAILLTFPDPQLLIKKLRSFEGSIQIHIIKNSDKYHPYRRMAKIYKIYTLPTGQRYLKLIGYDNFSARLPDPIYEKYMKIRQTFLKKIQ